MLTSVFGEKVGHIITGTHEDLSDAAIQMARRLLDRTLDLGLSRQSLRQLCIGSSVPGRKDVYAQPPITDPEVAARIGAALANAWDAELEHLSQLNGVGPDAFDNFISVTPPGEATPTA